MLLFTIDYIHIPFRIQITLFNSHMSLYMEIKSFVNKDELFTAIDNIVSFKKLKRTEPTAAQIRSVSKKDTYYEN